jgi:hypothetical protein
MLSVWAVRAPSTWVSPAPPRTWLARRPACGPRWRRPDGRRRSGRRTGSPGGWPSIRAAPTRPPASLAGFAQTEVVVGEVLADGETVVGLDQVDVVEFGFRPCPSAPVDHVGHMREHRAARPASQRAWCRAASAPSPSLQPVMRGSLGDPAPAGGVTPGEVARTEHDGGRAIGDATAILTAEAALHDRVEVVVGCETTRLERPSARLRAGCGERCRSSSRRWRRGEASSSPHRSA